MVIPCPNMACEKVPRSLKSGIAKVVGISESKMRFCLIVIKLSMKQKIPKMLQKTFRKCIIVFLRRWVRTGIVFKKKTDEDAEAVSTILG